MNIFYIYSINKKQTKNMNTQLTQKQIEIEKAKIALTYLVKSKKETTRNGYLGISLKEARGQYKETSIVDMWVEGSNVVILTDNYKFRKPVSTINKYIEY